MSFLSAGARAELVRRWSRKAAKAEELAPNVPLATLVMEGFELANFIEHYWGPHDELGLLGLDEYVRAQFTKNIAAEIRELAFVVSELQGRYNAQVEPPQVAPVERGEEILSELHRALAFLFDDGVDAREDKEVERVKREFNDRSSHDALAGSLDGTASYAAKHKKRLRAIPRFDTAILEEAVRVARQLRAESASQLARTPIDGRQAIRTQRAKVTRLLYERMAIARRTIRYAYADHPEVVQRATSDYRRERRQRQREKKRGAPSEVRER